MPKPKYTKEEKQNWRKAEHAKRQKEMAKHKGDPSVSPSQFVPVEAPWDDDEDE